MDSGKTKKNNMKPLFTGKAFAVMHVENFRLFLFYRNLMTMATLMQSVIVGWQIYDLTHDVLWLGHRAPTFVTDVYSLPPEGAVACLKRFCAARFM